MKKTFLFLLVITMFMTALSLGPPSVAASENSKAITEMQSDGPVTAASSIDYLTVCIAAETPAKVTEALTTETIQAQATSTTTVISHFTGVDEVAGYTLTTIKPDLTNYSPKKGLMVADEKTIIYKGAVFRSSFLFEVKLN